MLFGILEKPLLGPSIIYIKVPVMMTIVITPEKNTMIFLELAFNAEDKTDASPINLLRIPEKFEVVLGTEQLEDSLFQQKISSNRWEGFQKFGVLFL